MLDSLACGIADSLSVWRIAIVIVETRLIVGLANCDCECRDAPHCLFRECEHQSVCDPMASKFSARSFQKLGTQFSPQFHSYPSMYLHIILGTQFSPQFQRCQGAGTPDKVLGVVEGQPCRLPEGMTGVDSPPFAPTTCQGMPSNVPPLLLPPAGLSNSEGEGSLEISVSASTPIPIADRNVKNVPSI